MKAHLFVPTAKVGSPWSDLNVCTWEQLKEMSESGHIIVESHTRDLHYKVRAGGGLEPVFLHPGRIHHQAGSGLAPLAGPNAAVAADLVSSRVDIEAQVGNSADWLAWPYGFATDELDSLSRKIGFRGTVSLYPQAFTVRDSTLQVGRFALTAKSTLSHIANVFPR